MRPLQADPSTLAVLAARCRGWATELDSAPSPEPCSAAAETYAVLRSTDAAVCAVSADLTRRLYETADALDDTGWAYLSTDADSAATLG